MNPALEALLKKQPTLRRGDEQYYDQPIIKTGFIDLDKALPGGGWQTGTLTELLVERSGIGEFSLLLPALKSITNPLSVTALPQPPSQPPNQSPNQPLDQPADTSVKEARGDTTNVNALINSDPGGQWSALVNPPFIPYAPALSNAGVQLNRILIIDTDDDNDTLWSAEQLLRAGIFAMVVCWINKTDHRRQRRLQLAAETGRSLAIAYRPAAAIKQSSPAALRIHLSCQRPSHSGQHRGQHRDPNSSEHRDQSSELSNGLVLDILKSRGLNRSSLTINPHHFDAPQGIEWPGFNISRI